MVEGNHGDNVIDFYRVVTDIFKLDYLKQTRVVLFKCEWLISVVENPVYI